MDRNQAKWLLPIIKAFSEGKVIESRCIKGDTSLWYDDKDPSFDDDFEYRIKPEQKYRPFKGAEECWTEMQKHQPFGWLKDCDSNYYHIVSMGETFIGIVNPSGKIISKSYYDFYYACTFVNGTPFGMKVEE